MGGFLLRRQAHQGLSDNQPGMVTRDMGELHTSCHITNGIDPLVAGPQTRIYLDAGFRGLDPRGSQIKTFGVCLTSNGHQ